MDKPARASADQPAATRYPLTIIWPIGAQRIGCIEGAWRTLPDGRIEATYPDQLSLLLCIAPASTDADAEAMAKEAHRR